MLTVTTRQGKQVMLVSQAELRDPVSAGAYVRAYCHIHGSDHQRSLSINRNSGWGHCFNAACHATVIVAEWNPAMAAQLLHYQRQGTTVPAMRSRPPGAGNVPAALPASAPRPERPPLAIQPVLFYEPKQTPAWQRDELHMLLALEEEMQNALVNQPLAHLYLRGRGIPLEIAQSTGVGYLPPAPALPLAKSGPARLLRRWTGRLNFPLVAPGSRGFIGRSLWRWQPGMDENAHKDLLDRPRRPKRWIKTNPAGWFSPPFEQLTGHIILVEGAFDRLALLTAGFEPNEVIALAGTAIQPEWLPPQVHTLVLAFDGDEGGKEAATRQAEPLIQAGFKVCQCFPPQDHQGKDWNERWRKLGWEGIQPLWEQYVVLCSTA